MARSNNKKKKKSKSQKNKPKHRPQQRNMDPQSSSPLFCLPRELRDHVYTTLFSSTRLTFGKRTLSRIETQRMKPAANSLAILRSCRRVYEEAKDLWLGNVLFNFEHTEDLMDKLSALPGKTLFAIRHVRTGGRPIMMMPPGDDDDVYYRVPYVLKLLPGLRLDSLTVLGDTSPEVAYQTIEFFINYGHGWKELRFITHSSELLAFKVVNDILGPPLYQREPQPRAWNEAILRRDGRDSGASVMVYRSTRLDSGSVLKPSTRQPFNQNVTSPEALQNFAKKADQELLSDGEKGKGLLIVVKRGRDADISNVGKIQLNGFDLREWTNGMPWAQIRKECIDYLLRTSDDGFSDSSVMSDEEDIETDVYDDPDEYQFPSHLEASDEEDIETDDYDDPDEYQFPSHLEASDEEDIETDDYDDPDEYQIPSHLEV